MLGASSPVAHLAAKYLQTYGPEEPTVESLRIVLNKGSFVGVTSESCFGIYM